MFPKQIIINARKMFKLISLKNASKNIQEAVSSQNKFSKMSKKRLYFF